MAPQIVDLSSPFVQDLEGLNQGVQQALNIKLALQEARHRKELLDLKRQQYSFEQEQFEGQQQAAETGFSALGQFDPEQHDLQETLRIGYEIAGQMHPRDRAQFLDELGGQIKGAVTERKRAEVMEKLDRVRGYTAESGAGGEAAEERNAELEQQLAQADDPDEIDELLDEYVAALAKEDRELQMRDAGLAWAQEQGGFDPARPYLSSIGEMDVMSRWKVGGYPRDDEGLNRFKRDMLKARRDAAQERLRLLDDPRKDSANLPGQMQHAKALGLGTPQEGPLSMGLAAAAGSQPAPQGATVAPSGAASETAPTSPLGVTTGGGGDTHGAPAASPAASPDAPKPFAKVPRQDQEYLVLELEQAMAKNPTRSELLAIFERYGVDPDSLPDEVFKRLQELKTSRGRARVHARGVMEGVPDINLDANLLGGGN